MSAVEARAPDAAAAAEVVQAGGGAQAAAAADIPEPEEAGGDVLEVADDSGPEEASGGEPESDGEPAAARAQPAAAGGEVVYLLRVDPRAIRGHRRPRRRPGSARHALFSAGFKGADLLTFFCCRALCSPWLVVLALLPFAVQILTYAIHLQGSMHECASCYVVGETVVNGTGAGQPSRVVLDIRTESGRNGEWAMDCLFPDCADAPQNHAYPFSPYACRCADACTDFSYDEECRPDSMYGIWFLVAIVLTIEISLTVVLCGHEYDGTLCCGRCDKKPRKMLREFRNAMLEG